MAAKPCSTACGLRRLVWPLGASAGVAALESAAAVTGAGGFLRSARRLPNRPGPAGSFRRGARLAADGRRALARNDFHPAGYAGPGATRRKHRISRGDSRPGIPGPARDGRPGITAQIQVAGRPKLPALRLRRQKSLQVHLLCRQVSPSRPVVALHLPPRQGFPAVGWAITACLGRGGWRWPRAPAPRGNDFVAMRRCWLLLPLQAQPFCQDSHHLQGKMRGLLHQILEAFGVYRFQPAFAFRNGRSAARPLVDQADLSQA